jgi:hypothetical protein
MLDWHAYVSQYPITPYGGVILAGVGVCIIVGAFVQRFRQPLVWVGFALGVLLISLFGRMFARGLHSPTTLQLLALAVAIVFEFASFIVVMPRMRPRGERAVVSATMGIVGLHFLIMIPAFGVLIGLLALGCILNAGVFATLSRYPTGAAWFVDGSFKLTLGLAMVATSPTVYVAF